VIDQNLFHLGFPAGGTWRMSDILF